MLLLFALGCHSPGSPEGAPDTGPAPISDPSAYSYEPPEVTLELLTAEQVRAALAPLLADPRLLNSGPVLAAYDRVMAESDDGCPSYYESDGDVFWYDYCTSSDGATYDGYSFYTFYDGESDGQTTWTGGELTGLATVHSADGYTFDAGGTALLASGVGVDGDYDYTLHYSYVLGTFTWDGPEADGTWMQQGADPDLLLYGVDYPGLDGRYLMVEGGISALDGDLSAVVFDELIAANAGAGIDCPMEPLGAISVRDAQGNWYALRFDGEGNGPRSHACDGCADLMFQDQDLGPICVDVSTWLDWEEAPW